MDYWTEVAAERFGAGLKPEGITGAILDGRPRTVIVFDTGRLAVMD